MLPALLPRLEPLSRAHTLVSTTSSSASPTAILTYAASACGSTPYCPETPFVVNLLLKDFLHLCSLCSDVIWRNEIPGMF